MKKINKPSKYIFNGNCKNCPFVKDMSFEAGKTITVGCPFGGIRELDSTCNVLKKNFL